MARRKIQAPKMSPEQTAYVAARALFETTQTAFDERCVAEGLRIETDDEPEQERLWARADVIRAEMGLDAMRAAVRQAEIAMVDWSIAATAHMATVEQRAMLADLRQKAAKSPRHWPQLVDIAFRLAVAS